MNKYALYVEQEAHIAINCATNAEEAKRKLNRIKKAACERCFFDCLGRCYCDRYDNCVVERKVAECKALIEKMLG